MQHAEKTRHYLNRNIFLYLVIAGTRCVS